MSVPQSLEWDRLGVDLEFGLVRREELARVVFGVERLISEGEVSITRIVINNETDPNMLDQHRIRLVSTEVSSLEDSVLEHNISFSIALQVDY